MGKYDNVNTLPTNKVNGIAITDNTHQIDATEWNTLVQGEKDLVADVVQAQTDISTNSTNISTAQTNISNLQTSVNTNATNISTLQTNVNTNTTDITNLQSSVSSLSTRVTNLESNPVATVEVFLTSSSGNLTAANAPTYKMAIINDGVNPLEIWTSNGVNTWTQGIMGSGSFNYAPHINGFALKPNSVSTNGWTVQVTSISDNEADVINGTIIVDSVDYQTLPSITLGIPLEWAVTGQSTGTHSCILKIYDEAHPSGVSSTVSVKLVLPTSTLIASATKSQMTVSGTPDIATQATITKIRIAYRLQGTDADANAAVTAGRYFDLTAGGDIIDFQGAGYTKTGLNLTPGATYIPSVQITANTGTGVSQTGGWTAGTSMLIDPAPTAPVISATTTSSGNVTVTLTTPSTDATPETPTYDIAVWDSVGSVWVAKQTSIAANSPYLTGTALGTSYANGVTLQVRVTAKDAHSNAVDSNIVNLTVTNQPPSVSGLTITSPLTTGFTIKGTITDPESNATTEVDVVWSANSGDNPDTLFAGSNKAVYTAGADITAFTGSGKAIATTLTGGANVYVWVRAKDATGTGIWVQTNALVPDANTLLSDGFEGTIVSGNITQSGTGSVSFSSTNPISGSKSLVCNKAVANDTASYIVANPSISENFIRASVKFRIDTMPTNGTGVANIASIGKDWDLPFFTIYNNVAGANALQIGLSHDGYLISCAPGSGSGNWTYYGTPVTAGTIYTLEATYNRSSKAMTIKLNGTTIRSETLSAAGTNESQFDTIMLHNNGSGNYTGKITYDDFLMKKV